MMVIAHYSDVVRVFGLMTSSAGFDVISDREVMASEMLFGRPRAEVLSLLREPGVVDAALVLAGDEPDWFPVVKRHTSIPEVRQ